MDPWRSQIRCSFYFSSQQCACFQVVVLAGAGRLPSSGSAPLSATALEHRVRHPASLWGSARHASGAQTRTRASNCASNRQRAGTMSAASSSPSPGPRCVCRLSHHCRWSRAMRPSPLLGWKHLAAARRCRTDSRFRCLSQELASQPASQPWHRHRHRHWHRRRRHHRRRRRSNICPKPFYHSRYQCNHY